MTDIQGILGVFRQHFDGPINGDTNTDKIEPEIPIADDGIDIPPSDYDEVCIAFKRLKNNKAPEADGIPAELFKTGRQELIYSLRTLL